MHRLLDYLFTPPTYQELGLPRAVARLPGLVKATEAAYFVGVMDGLGGGVLAALVLLMVILAWRRWGP